MSKKDHKPSKMKNLFKLGFRKSTTDLSEWNKSDEKLMKAVEVGELSKIEHYLVKKTVNPTKLGPKGLSVFHVACQLGRADAVALLISQGAEVNVLSIQGNTSLQIASREGWPHIVEKLIEAGGVIDHKDGMSLTALHHSCVRGQVPCVQALLKYGADPNVRDKTGKPPLFYAAYSGFLPICKELLDKGAMVNGTDEQHLTPLMAASKQGNGDVCEFLLKKGADPALLDVHGQDALTYGLNEGYTDLSEVFRKAPARASWDVQQKATDKPDGTIPKPQVEEVKVVVQHAVEAPDDDRQDKENMVAKFVAEATPEPVHRQVDPSKENAEGDLDEDTLAERAASPPQSVIDQRTLEAYKELEEENEQMNEDLTSMRYKNKQLQEAYDGLKKQLSKPEVPPVDQEEVQELEDELSALKSQLSEEQDKNIRLIDKMKTVRQKYKGETENSDDDSWNDSDDELFESSTLTRKLQVVEHKPQTLLLLQNQVAQLRKDNKHLRERLQDKTGSVSSLASIEDPFSVEVEKMRHRIEELEADKQKLNKQIEKGNILPEEHQQNIAILEQENSDLHTEVKRLRTEINSSKHSSDNEKPVNLLNGDSESIVTDINEELIKSAIQSEQTKSVDGLPANDSRQSSMEVKKQIENLQTENSLLTEELDSLRDTYSKLVIAGDNLQDQYDQLVLEKEQVHEEFELLAKAKQELAKENEYLLSDANAMHDDIDRLVQEVEKVHESNQNLSKEKEDLEHRLNIVNVGGKASDFARITEERDKFKEKVCEFESINEELKKNHDIVLEEVQSLQGTVQQIEYERDQCQQEFDSLQDEFENIQGSHEGLQQDYTQLEQDYSDLLADKEKLEQDFMDVQTASVNLEHNNPALNSEVEKMKQDNADLIMEKEQLEMTMTELSKSNALIQEELNILKKALNQHESKDKKTSDPSVIDRKPSNSNSSSISSENSDKSTVDAVMEKDRRIRSLQIQISRLQQQLAEADKHYREVISTYRTHLLSAVQGHMDPEVKQALYNIIELRSLEQFC